MGKTIEKMSDGERAVLSRKINRGIEITNEMKKMEEELKAIKAELWLLADEEEAKIKSNKGLCEIKVSTFVSLASDEKTKQALIELLGDRFSDLVKEEMVLSIISGEKTRETLVKLLGERFSDLVKEEMVLAPTNKFKKIVKEPSPVQKKLSADLAQIAELRDQVAFRFIGEG